MIMLKAKGVHIRGLFVSHNVATFSLNMSLNKFRGQFIYM